MFPNCHVARYIFRFADFRPKSVRISLQTSLYSSVAVFFILQIVETIHTITHVAKFTVGKAVAVKLQTLRFRAVTGFSRSYTYKRKKMLNPVLSRVIHERTACNNKQF